MKNAGRVALAILFILAGITHFSSIKYDYVAMIPKYLPGGLWVIYLTGVLEIAGGVGLLVERTRRVAAICLGLLLLAMFPANVNASLQEIQFLGRDAPPLWIRTAFQLALLVMLWWTRGASGRTRQGQVLQNND